MNRLSTFLSSSFRLTKTCYPMTPLSRRYSFDEKNVKRKYPIGISDFKEIKEENYFFWDRTRFVKDFYEDSGKSILILRPRRWAKSTTVSMAKHYFNKNVGDPEFAKRLFAGTKIEEEKEFVSRTIGQFPVISISFGGCRANNWTDMKDLLRDLVREAYQEHRYLADGNFLYDDEQSRFKKFLNTDPTVVYGTALLDLTRLLYRYHGKRVIMLIDEYDLPLNEAHINGYYKEALPFLTSAFTRALKDNPYLEKGLLTGVLRVAKAGYLSGLNNLCVYSLLDKEYADMYGVQEKELKEALEHEGLTDKAADVKSYYNGYSTAIPSLLYNPWSILKYLSKKELQPYWVETGKIDFIANAMWSSPISVRQTILPLLDGKTLPVPVEIDIDYKILDSPKTLWSLLYFSGYLTGEKDGKELRARIPNTEINHELAMLWERVIEQKGFGNQYSELISGLLSGNQEAVEINLRTLARQLFSTYDVGRYPEPWYHGFLLGMLFPLKVQGYDIKSNPEAGLGRADIILYAPVGKPHIIIEVKTRTKTKQKVKEDENLRTDANNAIEQILKKEYFHSVVSGTGNKRAILWGIACVKKFVAVSVQEYPMIKKG